MRRCPAEIAPRRYMGNAFLAGQGGGMSDSKIKKYLNSTVGTDKEAPLDKVIMYHLAVENKTNPVEYTNPGAYATKVPAWAARVSVTACGGGGGGGNVNSVYPGTGGGGGAAVLNEIYQLAGIDVLTIAVGSGGVAAESSSESPTNGTATTIAELNLTLNGGSSGRLGNGGVGGSSGGAGGGAGGKINTAGSDGITGSGGTSDASAKKAGGGGGGSLGAGGNAAVFKDSGNVSVATAGVRGGGGGGGATLSYRAAKGGDGYVKLEFLP